MITYTEPNDTAASITDRMLGYCDESYAKKLWQANVNTFARQAMNDNGYFVPNRAVWLPGFSRHDEDPMMRDHFLHQLEYIHSTGRSNLVQLIKNPKTDLNELIGVHKTIAIYNQFQIDNPDSTASMFYAQMGGEILNRAVEHATHPVEKFSKTMKGLNSTTADLVNAEKIGDFDAMKQLRAQYLSRYRATNGELDRTAKLYANKINFKTRAILTDPIEGLKLAKRGGVWIDDFSDVKALEKIAEGGKWIGRGCFAFQLAFGVREVYDTYEKGGDWKGKALGVTAEMAAAEAAGSVFLMLTPPGWIALAGAAIVEGAVLALGGKSISETVKSWYEKRIHEPWRWF